MSTSVKALVGQAIPWKPHVARWVVIAEGAAASLVGLFVLVRTEQATVRIIQIVGAYILISALLFLYGLVVRIGDPPTEQGRLLRTGISLVVGLIALFHPLMRTIDPAAAATVLALGMSLAGAIGIYGVIWTRNTVGLRWDRLVVHGLYILFGLLVFLEGSTGAGTSTLLLMGWVALFSGLGLVAYGIWFQRRVERNSTPLSAAAWGVSALPPHEAVVSDSEQTGTNPTK